MKSVTNILLFIPLAIILMAQKGDSTKPALDSAVISSTDSSALLEMKKGNDAVSAFNSLAHAGVIELNVDLATKQQLEAENSRLRVENEMLRQETSRIKHTIFIDRTPVYNVVKVVYQKAPDGINRVEMDTADYPIYINLVKH